MLNITLIITIETVRIPAADRCSALRNVMTSLKSSFTRLARNNPSLFRLLPNSFRFSFDHHSLQRATHFLEIKGNRNQIVVAVDKWYLRVPSLERCILFIALPNAESSWIKQKTKRERRLYFLPPKNASVIPLGLWTEMTDFLLRFHVRTSTCEIPTLSEKGTPFGRNLPV